MNAVLGGVCVFLVCFFFHFLAVSCPCARMRACVRARAHPSIPSMHTQAICADPADPHFSKKLAWRLAAQLVDPDRPGDFNQALMEYVRACVFAACVFFTTNNTGWFAPARETRNSLAHEHQSSRARAHPQVWGNRLHAFPTRLLPAMGPAGAGFYGCEVEGCGDGNARPQQPAACLLYTSPSPRDRG